MTTTVQSNAQYNYITQQLPRPPSPRARSATRKEREPRRAHWLALPNPCLVCYLKLCFGQELVYSGCMSLHWTTSAWRVGPPETLSPPNQLATRATARLFKQHVPPRHPRFGRALALRLPPLRIRLFSEASTEFAAGIGKVHAQLLFSPWSCKGLLPSC